MANISAELAAIMAAILGEQVRGSIHDAIGKINDVSEHIFTVGSTDPTGNAIYSDLLYLNETTWDLFKSNSASPYAWSKIGNLEGNKITSITGPVTDPSTPLVDTYTINFSKIGPVTFNVTNGRGIVSITRPTSTGLIDTYTILYNDGTHTTFDVNNGKGIDSITGPVSAGLVDTYTINYNDDTTQTYVVTNGKDGNTVHRGIEVTGGNVRPTQFTLTEDCQTGDTYINTSGEVYECTQGASAGAQSLWKYSFSISGGGGTGVQNLYELTDVDASSVRTPQPNQILQYDGSLGQWAAKSGGNGHTMKPEPTTSAPYLTEAQVTQYIQNKLETPLNDEVASIFSIGHWTNVKRIRVIYSGDIGHTGIGTWKDGEVTAADEGDWWMNTNFTLLDNSDPSVDGYDVDFSIKLDPGNGEVITLGGYIIDTTTGKMCIRFANYVIDPSTAKIAVDITFTRTDVG